MAGGKGTLSTAAVDNANAVEHGTAVLRAARAAGLHVLHVTLGCFKTDGSDLEYFKQRALGDDHSKLTARMVPHQYAPAPGEAVLLTTTSSAFASTGLEQLLKNMHVVYPIFIGCYSDGCLGLTAAEAMSRGFMPTVVSDASHGSSRSSHLCMLRMFDQHWGRTRTAADLCDEMAPIGRGLRHPDHLDAPPTFPRKPRVGPAHASPRALRAQNRQKANAANMIQTLWRGKSARGSASLLDRKRLRAEQHRAATQIQSVVRGHMSRKASPLKLDKPVAQDSNVHTCV